MGSVCNQYRMPYCFLLENLLNLHEKLQFSFINSVVMRIQSCSASALKKLKTQLVSTRKMVHCFQNLVRSI